jgi:Kdo2-lipid IVA lauroyltransferase/acyltransferase
MSEGAGVAGSNVVFLIANSAAPPTRFICNGNLGYDAVEPLWKTMVFSIRDRFGRWMGYWVRDPALGLLNNAIHHSLRLASIDACSAFGAFISSFSAKRYAASDARARRNWRRLRPEDADPASTDAAMRVLWRSVSRTMCEFSVLHRLWPEGRIATEGVEHLEAVRRAAKPMIIAGLHLGNWETIPAAGIALGYPGSGFYWPLENRFDTRIAVKARERYGAVLFPASPQAMRPAMRAAIAALTEDRGPFVIFIDECIDDHVFAPAFGRPLKAQGNIANVAWLAWTTGAEVLPTYCERLGDEARFKITILPPVDLVRGGDRRGDLMTNIARINEAIEPVIRAHLDQWYYALDLELDDV